jgi:hypothetical protein
MLVFKSAPLKVAVSLTPNYSLSSTVKTKSKVIVSSEEKGEEYVNHVSMLIDSVYEAVEGDDEKLAIKLKERLQVDFGPQW